MDKDYLRGYLEGYIGKQAAGGAAPQDVRRAISALLKAERGAGSIYSTVADYDTQYNKEHPPREHWYQLGRPAAEDKLPPRGDVEAAVRRMFDESASEQRNGARYITGKGPVGADKQKILDVITRIYGPHTPTAKLQSGRKPEAYWEG